MDSSDPETSTMSVHAPPSSSANRYYNYYRVPGLCYNKEGSCTKLAVAFCKGCLMVGYCSKDCQFMDRACHRYLCKHARLVETERCPEYEFPANKDLQETWLNTRLVPEHEKTLWGKTPAFDILKLEANEGVDCQENLTLLFQGAHDLRSVMATVNGLPDTYEGELTIVINESDFDLQLRNILIIFLACEYQDTEFADFLTNLTYSASLPAATYSKFMTYISEKFKGCWAKIRQLTHLYPVTDRITQTWMNDPDDGSTKVSAMLRKEHWKRLATFLAPASLETLKSAEGKRYRLNCPGEPNYRIPNEAERRKAEATMPKFQQITHEKYLETGLLMPFDEYYKLEDDPHRVPNPTFFTVDGELMSNPFASPVDGWNLVELSETCARLGLPPNDLHGAVYYKTRDMYEEFCARIQSRRIRFIMSSFLLKGEVIEMLKKHEPPVRKSGSTKSWCFDRIFSTEWIGGRDIHLQTTIHIFSSFLSDSPHASICALLTKATDSSYTAQRFLSHDIVPERPRDALVKLLPFKWYVYSGEFLGLASELNIDGGWAKLVTHYLGEMEESEESLWQDYTETVLKESEESLWQDYTAFVLKGVTTESKESLWQNYTESVLKGDTTESKESLWQYYTESVLKDETNKAKQQTLREYLESKGLRLLWEEEMTIAEAWPFRMKRLDGDSGAAQDKCFQKYFGGTMKGSERFVEIRKI